MNFNLQKALDELDENSLMCYGAEHAWENHVYFNEDCQRSELRRLCWIYRKKAEKGIKTPDIVAAVQFASCKDMVRIIKRIINCYFQEIEETIKAGNQWEKRVVFQKPVAYGIGKNTDWQQKHPASGVLLTIVPDRGRFFKIVTCYPVVVPKDLPEWRKAVMEFRERQKRSS